MTKNYLIKQLLLGITSFFFINKPMHSQQMPLAKPSAVQYKWHEQERIMFIHFGAATWLGSEYDEKGDFDISRMNPDKTDTDEWCRVAKSWGAKQIIFVAKHVGGFCWWPTTTTEYCVRNIPWKKGKGDLLREVELSCKKAGLNLGIYIYPGDYAWGAGIGSGGKTADPSKQEGYNKLFRQQLTEVLSLYGKMTEVWFDGSCIINVDDILDKYAKNAVIFQGPKATLRWPGSENGKLYYPVWNSVKTSDLKSGVSTQYNDDPDGDAWAPLESDVPLYNHNWFWAPENEKKRRSLDELVEMYYKSAGYGGVLLLNSTPDTTGQIPVGDKKTYTAFGNEIVKRFSNPIASLLNKKGEKFEIKFSKPTFVNHCILMEDYRRGQRIREYNLHGMINNKWQLLATGSSVGRKKIDPFTSVQVTALRLTITRSVNTPLLRSFEAFNAAGYQFKPDVADKNEGAECGTWDTQSFINGRDTISLDLSKFITKPGQYELKLIPTFAGTRTWFDKGEIIFEKDVTLQEYLIKKDDNTFYINRTSQVGKSSSSVLKLYMISENGVSQNKGIFKIRSRPLGN
jgi:alpha-L-fucosidase